MVLFLLVVRNCMPVELEVPIKPTWKCYFRTISFLDNHLTDIDPPAVSVVVLQRVVVDDVNDGTDNVGLQSKYL